MTYLRRVPSLFLTISLAALLVGGASAQAALLAYEPFTNAPGANVIGSSDGSGFNGAWQINSGGGVATNTDYALHYTDSLGNTLVTAGGAGFFQGLTSGTTSMQPIRLFNFSRGTNGTDGVTTWISFIAVRQGPVVAGNNPYPRGANVPHDIHTGALQKLAIGNSTGAATNTVGLIPQGAVGNLRPSTVLFSVTNFIVVRIDHVAGAAGDNAWLFVNPTLSSEPSTSQANTNSLGAFDFSFDRLRVFCGGNVSAAQPYAEMVMDEYRIGESYADVAPFSPPVLPGGLLRITNVALIPGNIVLSGSGGSNNAAYQILASATLAVPSTSWPAVATNSFDANGNFIHTNPLPPADQQFYRVRIAPPVGPSILTPPASLTVTQNQNASFTVTADGTPPLSYQWFFNTNTALNGATFPALTITNAQSTNAGAYSVRVMNSVGSITSAVATLTVLVPVSIANHPQDQSVTISNNATFSVTASGTAPLSYQWYFNTNTAILSATNASLTITNVQLSDAGKYSVTVSNLVNSLSSGFATLTVNTSGVPLDFSLIGFATTSPGTTGGAGGSTITVSNAAGFQSALAQVGPVIVQVQGTISIGNITANRANKTILGLGANAGWIGNVTFDGATNIIVRNLSISYPGGSDGITIQDLSRNIWIDHCSFSDCGDGQLDITHGSDFVTVSWCKFSYTPAQAAHRFCSLVGHDENNAAEDAGRLHITYHHNWWSTLVTERMPRVRFGRIHVFNNYFNSPGNNYCVRASLQSELLVENNHFENINTPYEKFVELSETGLINAVGNATVNCTSVQSFSDTVFTPPYSYSAQSTAGLPAIVTANAGAGAGPFAP